MTGERDLARQARLGDRDALEALARRWLGPVYAVCYRFLGRPDEARDAAQEAFRKMTQSIGTFDETRAFGPWALAIARNCARDLLAKRGRQPASLDAAPEPVALPAPMAPDVEKLREMVKRLEGIERGVLEMRLRGDMSLEEIAKELELPAGTVRSHASRAIAKLRGWMKEDER